MSTKLQSLLARFAAVRDAGPGRWRARRHGSNAFNVAIALAESGAILLHDHAGRTPAEVLAEIGLSLADLAPDRLDHNRQQTPQERAQARRALALASIESVAEVLDANASSLQQVAATLADGAPLDAEAWHRLLAAQEAIEAARTLLRGGP